MPGLPRGCGQVRSGSVCAVTSRVRSPISRRTFLAAGGLATAALATGCGAVDGLLGDDGEGGDASTASPKPESSDEDLVSGALAEQERLLALCLAVRARNKSVRAALKPLIEHHRTHVRILGGEPSNERSGSGVSSPRKALTTLRRREAAAAKRRARDAQRAESGELARVLAAISASQRQHEYVLDEALGSVS